MIFGIKLGTRKIDKACQVVIGVLCVIIHSVPAVMTLNMCNTILSDVEKDLKYILSIFCVLSLPCTLYLSFTIFRNMKNVYTVCILSFILKFKLMMLSFLTLNSKHKYHKNVPVVLMSFLNFIFVLIKVINVNMSSMMPFFSTILKTGA